MKSGALIVGVLAVAAATPAWAQQPVEVDNPSTLRSQVRTFEFVVQEAVRRGGAQLNQKAREIQPRVGLQMLGLPIVTGVYLPEQGFHFDVQVPDILPSALNMFVTMQNTAPRPGAVPVATPGPVKATGVVPDDPAKPGPAAAAADFEPQRAYGDFVRNMLVEAMIDSSTLPLRAGERLTIRARVPQMSVNPLLLTEDRELLLSVLADDLLAFRQGQLTRADVQARIKEYRY